MILRPYQQNALDQIRESFRNKKTKVLVCSPTGSGKGVMLSSVINSAAAKGTKVLFLVHRSEILFQVSEYMDRYDIKHGLIKAGEIYDPRHNVDLASVQTMIRRIKHKDFGYYDMIVVDECFPAGTLIDGRRIETLRAGDTVASFNETTRQIENKRVVGLFKNEAHALVTVTLADGRKITCTPNHPFFVANEWKPAILLQGGDMVHCVTGGDISERTISVLPCVSKTSSRTAQETDGVCKERQGVLQQGVFSYILPEGIFGNNGKYKQGSCVGKNEIPESDGESGNSGEDENIKKSQRDASPDTVQQGGQRDRSDNSTAFDGYGAWMGNGIRRWIGRSVRRLSHLLQAGHSKPAFEGGDRSGRQKSQRQAENIGRKEGRQTIRVGVESVEVHQPGSDGRFGGLCPDGYVYNIEVTGNHNYFANGTLVHNCHHSTAQTYRDIIDKYDPKLLIGFTATPCRSTGLGLGTMYNSLIVVATMQDLVDQGYLVPVRYFAPFEPDLKGVKITAGDYNLKQLNMTMMQGAITANIVEKWQQLGENRQTVCFTTTVAHSVAVCEKFRAEGIKAEHVDGCTDQEERKDILRRYARGEFKILCNCAVFTEGVDIPSIACVLMARPTKSIVMYLQCVGRGMRLAEGKTDMILLDMAGVYWEHGPITEITNWTLNEKTKAASSKNEERKERNSRPITCLSCHHVYTGQLKCPHCGTIPVKERYGQDVEEIDAVLGEIVYRGGSGKEKSKKERPATMEEKQSWFSQLIQHGKNKGFKDGYAAVQYREKFGVWPNQLEKTPKPITSTVQDWLTHQRIKKVKAKNHVPTSAGLPL